MCKTSSSLSFKTKVGVSDFRTVKAKERFFIKIDVGDLLLLVNILPFLDFGKLLNLNTSLVPNYQDSDVIDA